MRKEKHIEAITEVLDEIESALNDNKGLVAHQRRLAFSLSLGAVNLLELYFHNNNIMKEGSKIDHRWFKRKIERIFVSLENQITSQIRDIENISQIIKLMQKIEDKRDDLAYGAPATENILQEKNLSVSKFIFSIE